VAVDFVCPGRIVSDGHEPPVVDSNVKCAILIENIIYVDKGQCLSAWPVR
jgi:hypothetical protein